MKKIWITAALAAMPLTLVAQTPKKTNRTATAPPAAAQSDSSPSVPAGAKEVEPFTYSYTDAQGKKWIYRKTAFGVVKMEDKGVADHQPTSDDGNPMVVTDLGDSVRFERKTPFGVEKIVRKKSELTDDERAALDHSKQGSSTTAKP